MRQLPSCASVGGKSRTYIGGEILLVAAENFRAFGCDLWHVASPRRGGLLRVADVRTGRQLDIPQGRACNCALQPSTFKSQITRPAAAFEINEKEETIMDRMLVVVFDNESKAYEGSRSLQQLDGDGSIAVYATGVVAKNPDGTASVKEGADTGPLGNSDGHSGRQSRRSIGRSSRCGSRCRRWLSHRSNCRP